MKSMIIMLICLCIILCACTTTKALPTNQLPTQGVITAPTLNTVVEDPIYDEPFIAISTPVVTEESFADDGTLIFTYSFQDITLTMDDPIVAESIMDDFMNRNDFFTSAQPMLASAKAAYTGQDDWSAHSCRIIYNPVRLDQGVLSLYGSEVVDNGGPRSTSTNISVSYDLLSGKALTLTDILIDGYSSEKLIEKIIGALESYSQQGILFTDYEYIISDQFSTNTPINKWYFSNAGICFYFSPYEIAPYNAGTVVAAIPYSELVGLMKDIYFPAEQIPYHGTISAVSENSTETGAYQRITEIILQNSGKEYFIAPNGTALNVRIQLSTSDNENLSYTVYAATALTKGDAVMLQIDDSSKKQLTISYNDIIDYKLFP